MRRALSVVQTLGDVCCEVVDWSRVILLVGYLLAAGLAFIGQSAACLLLILGVSLLIVGAALGLFVLSLVRDALRSVTG